MSAPSNFYAFILIRALPAWLALPRSERARIAGMALTKPVSEEEVSFRYFDAEAFSARCSDLIMMQIKDVRRYSFAIEGLRDSALFAEPYFELIEIIPALEDGYVDYERSAAAAS